MSDSNRQSFAWPSKFYRNRHLLIMTLIVLAAAGWSAWQSLPKIEDPRIVQRFVSVITEFPGASARLVESAITERIEASVASISEIKKVDSTSRANVSFIVIELEDEVTAETNRELISRLRDRIKGVSAELPEGAKEPFINQDETIAAAYTVITALRWNGEGEPQLRILNRLAEVLEDRLEAVDGTEFVNSHGEPEEQVLVEVDASQLSDMGLTIGQLAQLIDGSDSKQVAGRLIRPNSQTSIEVRGEFDSLERIRTLPVRSDRADTRLGDIATVKKTFIYPETAETFLNGERVVLVSARAKVKSQIRPWTELIKAELTKLEEETGGLVSADIVFEQANYTEDRLSTLGQNLLAGIIAVLIVVLVFMGWRSGLIVATSLPLSAACVLFALNILDLQIQQMSIFGMIVAIGLLIDNAIVMTDEVRERMQHGDRAIAAIEGAVQHLFAPLLASTLTTILAFMPILLIKGASGDFIGTISVSVILALIASFIISMTIIPALSAWLEGNRLASDKQSDSWWQVGIASPGHAERFKEFLIASIKRPWISFVAALTLAAIGVFSVGSLPKVFFPAADRDMFEIRVWFPSNMSVPAASPVIKEIDAHLHSHDAVEQTVWMIGESIPSFYYNQIMNNGNSPFYAESVITVESVADAERLIDQLQIELDDKFPNVQVVVKAFAQGPPVEAPIEFRIFGPETNMLRELGEELRATISAQPGVLHTRASVEPGMAKIWFDAEESALNQVGLRLGQVAGQMASAYEGLEAGSILEDIIELPVRVKYADSERESIEDLRTFPIVLPNGEWAPASAFGRFVLEPDSTSITRKNGERVNIIHAYVDTSVTPLDMSNQVASLIEGRWQLPDGYRWEMGGDSEESNKANASLAEHLPVLLLIMITSLVLAFRSFTLAGIIGVVAMISAGFGLFSLWLSGYPLGFNPLLGITGLIGVAINGSIVVLAGIRANEAAARGETEAIAQVVLSTSRHIMSTTLTTIAGFIPLILFVGGKFWPPLAVVIAGGVGFSIMLSLWFTPCLYAWIYRRRKSPSAPSLQCETA